MTPEEKAVIEAIHRLGSEETNLLWIGAMQTAIRALIVAHPEPSKVRHHYDQLIAQLAASPAVAGHPDKMVVLRGTTESLFCPPITLDT